MSLHITDEMLSAAVDGALLTTEKAELASHLAACEACRHRLDLLSATSEAVAGLPEEPTPSALDLSFLGSATPAGRVVSVSPARWRPPVWAVPAAAAAALLILGLGVGPSLLNRQNTAATSAGLSAGLPQASPFQADRAPVSPFAQPAVPALGSATRATSGGGQALGPPGIPGGELGTSASQAYPDAGGMALALRVSSTNAARGEPLGLNVQATAGSAISLRGLSIGIRGPGGYTQLASTSGVRLGDHQVTALQAGWAAGQQGGTAQGGDYMVEGHAILGDGRDVHVTVAIHVR